MHLSPAELWRPDSQTDKFEHDEEWVGELTWTRQNQRKFIEVWPEAELEFGRTIDLKGMFLLF